MRLATIALEVLGARCLDGQLVAVERAGEVVAVVEDPSDATLLKACEKLQAAQSFLADLEAELLAGKAASLVKLSECRLLAPLPRTFAFFDGSAFLHHVRLARRARGAEVPADLGEVPLMYQGASDGLLA